MLRLLHIENIAVIEQAEIAFDRGFNVLTGETGAGKSIVIDAISAILGERTYRDVIRTGADRAFVSAVFDGVPDLPWFAENRVEYDPSELLVQREVYADGKNVCRVNGRPVTVAILKKLGGQLVNIHGQHDSQQLFDETKHLSYLDLFARNEAERTAYAACYAQVQALRREQERLTLDEGEKLRRVEALQYQLEEIGRAALQPGEDEQLENRRKLLQNAEKLSEALTAAAMALSGGEDASGAVDLVGEADHALARIARYDEGLAALGDRLSNLQYELEDVAGELRDHLDQMAYSGEELEQIESRLDVIHRLKRKYGGSVEEILQYAEKAQRELDEITFSEERLAQLEKELAAATAEAKAAGLLLRATRQTAARAMETRLSQELAALDMPRAQFVCQLEETDLTPDGLDSLRFLMTANVGEALKPLSKVASGGELARIMLAIKNVLAEQDRVGTLIFDEVDAGVSGRAAQKVAEKLRAVSKNKQVLCVTHLPQIAAAADVHLLIAKTEREGRTYTQVTALDRPGRTREIARIIGGAEITETTLRSAGEMLQSDRDFS